jgi:YbbR domain-containing protein
MQKNNKPQNPFNSRWFFRISALVLAVLLFIYVNGEKLGNTHKTELNTETTSLTSTKKKTLTMPLDLTVDSDRYIVSGYPKNVKVTVSGPAALVTATANTQNFKVYADLSSLGPGKHVVKPKQTGLNNDLTYHFKPKQFTVLIQSRKTESMAVQTKVDTSQLADGYKAGKATTSTDNVQITGAIAEVNKVDHVVASVSLSKKDKTNISKQVTLQAVDKNGNTVNVVITPQTTTIKIPISKQNSAAGSSSSSSSDSGHSTTSDNSDNDSSSSSDQSSSNSNSSEDSHSSTSSSSTSN